MPVKALPAPVVEPIIEGPAQEAIEPAAKHPFELKEGVGEYLTERKRPAVTMKRITAVVAEFYGITPADITGPRRHLKVVVPRQIAIYLVKQESMSLSLLRIGKAFGDRDHTTSLFSIRKITALVLTDPKIAADISAIKAIIAGEGGK